ncbi:MAG: HEAT repeat domain-containing protein [Oscillospiraceae bacterium]
MVLRVDYLIFTYMFLALCMLFFDFGYLGWKRWFDVHEPKKAERYRQHMVLMLLNSDTYRLSPEREKHIARKLRHYTNLLTFHETVSEILLTDDYGPMMKRWIVENRELFLKISESYLKGDSQKGDNQIKKALFAYVVWHYGLCTPREGDPFAKLLYKICREPSLYCRENALCGLYVSGSTAHVVKAYRLLTQWGVEHNQRLVTDGLMLFAGDHNALAEALWAHWDEFSDFYHASFINYIRMTSDRFGSRFFHLLQTQDVEKEVKFSILRYFRRYYDRDAEHYLQEVVRNRDQVDWEFASVAALALENYPGVESVEALLEACHSAHFYVRNNAAESLLKIAKPHIFRDILARETDPFTKEMLTYKCLKTQEVPAL